MMISASQFLQYCHSDVTSSTLCYHALVSGDAGTPERTRSAMAVIHNLLATNKQVHSSPLVIHCIQHFLRESFVHSSFPGAAWCVKRLRTLQHNSAETAALYHRAVLHIQDMLPLVSAYNTSSELHAMLRVQHSQSIAASRVLESMDAELHALLRHLGQLAPQQQKLLASIVIFLHRCMTVVHGTLTFLQPSVAGGALVNSLASHLILLHDKISTGRDAVYLTVLEGLCSNASDATVELLFQHFLLLFVTDFATAGDIQVTYLQGVLLRIMRGSFAHRRHTLRAFAVAHDSLGEIAACIHNHSGTSPARHTASLCVLGEILALLPNTNTRSFDLVLQTVLVELDRCRTQTLADIYLHLLLLLLGKRSARIAHDLTAELVRVVTSRTLPLHSHQVLDVLDLLAGGHRMALPHASCQAVFAYAMQQLVAEDPPVHLWVRCLKLLRAFIHQMNTANMITVLEHARTLVTMIDANVMHPGAVAQVLYVLRYAVCRLLVHKDLVRDRLDSLGVAQHVLAHLQTPPRAPTTQNRVLENAYIRTIDLLLMYDLIPRAHAAAFAVHCARVVARYERNAKMVTDVLRVLLRTAGRYKIATEAPFESVAAIVHGVAQVRTTEGLGTVKLRLTLVSMLYRELGDVCLCSSTAPCAAHHASYQLCCSVFEFCRHAFLVTEHDPPAMLRHHADFLRLAASCLAVTFQGKHSPYWEERLLKQIRDHCVEICQAMRVDALSGSETVTGCVREVRRVYEFAQGYLRRVGWA